MFLSIPHSPLSFALTIVGILIFLWGIFTTAPIPFKGKGSFKTNLGWLAIIIGPIIIATGLLVFSA